MQLRIIIVAVLFSAGCVLATEPAKNEPRDLATDVETAQNKLAAFIQEALKFSSTYQVILNADILLAVNNNFEQIYSYMQILGVAQATIDEIKVSAAQDTAVMTTSTDNLEEANNGMISGAYVINRSLRNGSLTEIGGLYNSWAGDALTLFNQRYQLYTATLSLTGNSVELAIVSAITGFEGPEVTAIFALLQKTNDLINSDAELMSRELVIYDYALSEAFGAVQTVINQV